VYALRASLPDAPLRAFQVKVKDLPRTTEVERLVVQRIGQDIFRASLMDYWQGRCPLTGIANPDLLRSSHVIPWSESGSDAQRLDVHNGLLLTICLCGVLFRLKQSASFRHYVIILIDALITP
jgi:hypothetical protein